MAAARKFDWDEAARLRGEGLSCDKIGARLGVTGKAVWLALSPEGRRRSIARVTEWQRGGSCPDCGAQTTRHHAAENRRCSTCAGKHATTTVRADTLLCSCCNEWKPDEAFSRNRVRDGKPRRQRSRTCRVCDTRLRREYRDRQKIPCVNCGSPRLPARENGSKHRGTQDTGLCLDCYRATLRKAAA